MGWLFRPGCGCRCGGRRRCGYGASRGALRLFAVGGSATIGQFCLTRAFTSGEPAKVSVVGLSQVGFGMLFDLFLWDRTFNGWTLVGMALVVAPTAWLLLRWRT